MKFPSEVKMSFTDNHINLVNQVLVTATALGAYNIGIVSALAVINRVDPTLDLLGMAATAPTPEEAVRIFKGWYSAVTRECPVT